MTTIDLGDQVALAVTITTAAGAAGDAGAVTCTITLPDGATVTPTVGHPATGTYTAAYTPTLAGTHTVRWVATGANASAYSDSFTVADPTRIPVVSLDDAKRHLNITSSGSDEELRAMLNVAVAAGEAYTGRVFGRREMVDVLDGGATHLTLSAYPVADVDTVTVNGAVTTGWVVDSRAGVIRSTGAPFDGSTPGNVTVVYTAGGVAAATDRQGVLEMLRHLWETQRGSMPMLARDDGYDPGRGYSLPRRVTELWDLAPVAGFA